MALVQEIVCSDVFQFAGNIVQSFTTDFELTAGGGAGANPTEGNSLIVVIQHDSVTIVDAPTTNQSDVFTLDYEPGNSISIYRIDSISAGVTEMQLDFSGGTTPQVWIFELDAVVEEGDNSAYASTGDGFVTAHGIEYTTSTADELVICIARCTSGSKTTWTGTGGATSLQDSAASTTQAVIYAIIASAATADISWTMNAAGNATAALISYALVGGSSPGAVAKLVGPGGMVGAGGGLIGLGLT